VPLRKKIVAKLVGGLGNQIFIYFAALDLAKTYNRELILDFSFIERSHSEGNSRLDAFIIEGSKLEKNRLQKGLKEWTERIVDSLSRHNFWVLQHKYLDESNLDCLKYSPRIRKYILRGFHSTAKYFESLGKPNLKLVYESDLFRELRIELSKSVAIHIRGGDFALYSASLGPLSPSYYLNALTINDEIKQAVVSEKIFIFSDDRERSSKMKYLLEEKGLRAVEISFEYKLTPAEELLLLSEAKVLIMANSTFSFWASEFSKNGTVIICPESFTRTGESIDFNSARARIINKCEWE
jgi:Glycosyl transferase family 11